LAAALSLESRVYFDKSSAAVQTTPRTQPIFTKIPGAPWRISASPLGQAASRLIGKACIPEGVNLRALRSPRSIFWEAPDGGRPSNSPNRRADSMQFIQINIRRLRRLDELPLAWVRVLNQPPNYIRVNGELALRLVQTTIALGPVTRGPGGWSRPATRLSDH
jgi:hypothetical protein